MIEPFRLTSSTKSNIGLLCALLIYPSTAFGIGMRHDIPNVNSTGLDNPYVQLGSELDAVARLTWTTHRGSFHGSGTLVSSMSPGQYKFLTAAHVVDGNSGANWPDGIIDASEFTIEFGDNPSSITHRVSVPSENVAVQPRWSTGDPAGTLLLRGAAQFDLAVMTFTTNDFLLGSANTLPNEYGLTRNNVLGETATIAGFGRYGLGDEFASNSDGVRCAGRNVVDAVDFLSAEANDGYTIRTDFDSGVLGANRSVAGYDGEVDGLEASTANGDSGGSLLLMNGGRPLVAGVLHGGYNHFTNADDSEYGDVGVWASVNEPINQLFLQANGVAYRGFGVESVPASIAAVPEPSSVVLLFFSLFGLQLRTRRS